MFKKNNHGLFCYCPACRMKRRNSLLHNIIISILCIVALYQSIITIFTFLLSNFVSITTEPSDISSPPIYQKALPKSASFSASVLISGKAYNSCKCFCQCFFCYSFSEGYRWQGNFHQIYDYLWGEQCYCNRCQRGNYRGNC